MSSSSQVWRAALVAAAAAGACALLAGCSGSLLADHLPTAVGGLPADAPVRPAETAYPAVHNMPPSRTAAPLSDDQQKQLADELIAARNRYGANPTDEPTSTGSTPNSKAASARNQ
jgi:hypothetical protein